jgi:hypothetical protein
MRVSRVSAPAVLAALLAAAAALGAANERTVPQNLTPIPGRIGVMTADPVTTGTFEGTWMYVNRDARYAMWIREESGKPRIRIQYQSLATPEAFETDWNGKSSYFMSGDPVTFELKITSADANRIAGTWHWNLDAGPGGREESADVVLQRTVYGRTLLLDFKNFERTFRQGGVPHTVRIPVAWNWQKVSKRELLWDEMPW